MIWRIVDILGKVNLVEIIVNKIIDFVMIDQGRIIDDYNVFKFVLVLLFCCGIVKFNNGSKDGQFNVLEQCKFGK